MIIGVFLYTSKNMLFLPLHNISRDGNGIVVKEQFKEQEEKLKPLEEKFDQLMVRVPNIISPDTPEGKSDADNKEIFHWGTQHSFDFTPKDHM